MKALDYLLSLPVAFVLFTAIAGLLYLLGKRMAPKLNKAGGKLTTYACGEDIPGAKIQFGYRLFFFIALFFTIMHVAALMIATVPAGSSNPSSVPITRHWPGGTHSRERGAV